jgi:histidyl-tRNA synthetase
MVEDKGLDPQVADKIHEYVMQSGGPELVESLLQSPLKDNPSALQGLQELQLLYTFLNVYEITPKIRFDMSLARGLDYYTGIIYEAIFKSTSDSTSGIGSIAAGGRYDNLVGMFSSKSVPCVGISIGVERVFAILTRLDETLKPRSSPTNVYVTSPDGHLVERMKIANELWKVGVNTEFTYKAKVKIGKELSACDQKQIGVVVIIGKSEIEAGVVKIKDLKSQVEYEVLRGDMVAKVKEMVEVKEDIWDLNVE